MCAGFVYRASAGRRRGQRGGLGTTRWCHGRRGCRLPVLAFWSLAGRGCWLHPAGRGASVSMFAGPGDGAMTALHVLVTATEGPDWEWVAAGPEPCADHPGFPECARVGEGRSDRPGWVREDQVRRARAWELMWSSLISSKVWPWSGTRHGLVQVRTQWWSAHTPPQAIGAGQPNSSMFIVDQPRVRPLPPGFHSEFKGKCDLFH